MVIYIYGMAFTLFILYVMANLHPLLLLRRLVYKTNKLPPRQAVLFVSMKSNTSIIVILGMPRSSISAKIYILCYHKHG